MPCIVVKTFLLDPYVKVNLLYSGERVSKWKTSIAKNSLNPLYQESCELDLTVLGEEELQLHVLVTNSDAFARNREIGKVKFGQDVPGYRTGQVQWNQSLAHPNVTITAWHPLFPPPPTPPKKLHLAAEIRSKSASRSPLRSRSPVYLKGLNM